MRTIQSLVFLATPLFAMFFSGCAADVKFADDQARQSADQQLLEGAQCISGSLPANGCIDYGDFKMQAWDACQQADLQLVNISVKPIDGCDNVTSGGGDYECCPVEPSPPPPPPPEGCVTATLDNASCQNAGDSKLAAYDACKLAGLELFNLVPNQGDCPNGEAISTTYECCPAPPAPPPPQICLTATINTGNCQGYGDLKMAAYEACNAAGLILVNLIDDHGNCPDGEAISTTYECASNGPCP